MIKAPKYPRIDNPSTRIYWEDLHSEPGLKMCSLAARGLWTYHMLAIMAGASGYLAVEGRPITVKQLAALAGSPLAEVQHAYDELLQCNVFSVDRYGTPFNRRMVKAQKKAGSSRKNGQNGGRPKLLNTNGEVDNKTYSEPTDNLTPNLKDDPRAGGLQDFLLQDFSLEPKNPSEESGVVVDLFPAAEPEPPKKQYAFEGAVVRLNQRDLDQWKASYSRLDLVAELQARDDWLRDEAVAVQKKWFQSTSSWLARRNQEAPARKRVYGDDAIF